MNRFESYLTKADSAYQAGFKSKAAKDRACSCINSALQIVVDEINDAILVHSQEERQSGSPLHNLYWDLCDVGCVNFIKKSAQVLPLLGDQAVEWMAMGEQCVALYTTYKNAPINEVPVSPINGATSKVQGIIKEMMEQRNEKFNRCLHLQSVFGAMGVTANVHLVSGHTGTVYVRAFYYVMGVLTPLSTIIASMQEAERQKLLG